MDYTIRAASNGFLVRAEDPYTVTDTWVFSDWNSVVEFLKDKPATIRKDKDYD